MILTTSSDSHQRLSMEKDLDPAHNWCLNICGTAAARISSLSKPSFYFGVLWPVRHSDPSYTQSKHSMQYTA